MMDHARSAVVALADVMEVAVEAVDLEAAVEEIAATARLVVTVVDARLAEIAATARLVVTVVDARLVVTAADARSEVTVVDARSEVTVVGVSVLHAWRARSKQ